MNGKEFQWNSKFLQQEMSLRVYGDAGKLLLAFPTENGRYFDLENFGIVSVAQEYIEEGKLQIAAIDGRDSENWLNHAIHPEERAQRYDNYVRYVISEVVPFLREEQSLPPEEKLGLMGISLGGYHALNLFFRFPDLFDLVLSLSGKLQLEPYIGDYMDETVYYNAPMHYLKNLTDENYLDKYRESQIIICAGQGKWEEEMAHDAMELQMLLRKKKVRSWLDIWGYDVDHDWKWWRNQCEYFLEQLFPLHEPDEA